MDKKLVAAFTFGLLAVSMANVLLSVGIISLILTEGPGSDTRATDAGAFPGAWTMNSMSLADTNNTTVKNVSQVADMPVANATVTPAPQTGKQMSAGMPAGGQFTPPSGDFTPPAGWSPPSGQGMPPGQSTQASGQASASGQLPSTTAQTGQTSTGAMQMPSGTGQIPSGTQPAASGTGTLPYNMNQYLSGTGSLPGSSASPASGTGTIPVDVTSLTGNQGHVAATPRPTSVFGNFSSLWND